MAPLRAGARSSITAPRPPRRNARAFGGGAEARARAKQRERRGRKIFRFRRRRTCGGRRRRALPSFGGTRSIRVPCASAAPLPSLLLTPKYGAERRDTRSIGRRDPERPTGRVGRPADSPKHNVFFSLSSLSPSNSIPLSPAFLFFLSLSFRFFFFHPSLFKRTKVVRTSQVLDNGRHGDDEYRSDSRGKKKPDGKEKKARFFFEEGKNKKRVSAAGPALRGLSSPRPSPRIRLACFFFFFFPSLDPLSTLSRSLVPKRPYDSPITFNGKTTCIHDRPGREIGPGGARTRHLLQKKGLRESRSAACRCPSSSSSFSLYLFSPRSLSLSPFHPQVPFSPSSFRARVRENLPLHSPPFFFL